MDIFIKYRRILFHHKFLAELQNCKIEKNKLSCMFKHYLCLVLYHLINELFYGITPSYQAHASISTLCHFVAIVPVTSHEDSAIACLLCVICIGLLLGRWLGNCSGKQISLLLMFHG